MRSKASRLSGQDFPAETIRYLATKALLPWKGSRNLTRGRALEEAVVDLLIVSLVLDGWIDRRLSLNAISMSSVNHHVKRALALLRPLVPSSRGRKSSASRSSGAQAESTPNECA